MTEEKKTDDEKIRRAPKGSVESQLPLRMSKELRDSVRRAAKDEALSEAEWIRQACEAALPAEGPKAATTKTTTTTTTTTTTRKKKRS